MPRKKYPILPLVSDDNYIYVDGIVKRNIRDNHYQLSFKCPWCNKGVIHYHGLDEESYNIGSNYETRMPHCLGDKPPNKLFYIKYNAIPDIKTDGKNI